MSKTTNCCLHSILVSRQSTKNYSNSRSQCSHCCIHRSAAVMKSHWFKVKLSFVWLSFGRIVLSAQTNVSQADSCVLSGRPAYQTPAASTSEISNNSIGKRVILFRTIILVDFYNFCTTGRRVRPTKFMTPPMYTTG